jgi:hypothetical protein
MNVPMPSARKGLPPGPASAGRAGDQGWVEHRTDDGGAYLVYAHRVPADAERTALPTLGLHRLLRRLGVVIEDRGSGRTSSKL